MMTVKSSMMPSLMLASMGGRGTRSLRHIAENRPLLHFRSGRLALAHALGLCGVQADSEVLVPAYHCPSIIDPIEALGGNARFYRLSDRLKPDIADLERRITPNTKAVIAVHFFGENTDLNELRTLCDQTAIKLIEDCAHCFGYVESIPAYGRTGDFVITSSRKFLPTFDGGELFSPKLELSDANRPGSGAKYQFKIIKNTIERSSNASKKQSPLTITPGINNLSRNTPAADGESTGYTDPRFDYRFVNFRPSVSSMTLGRLLSMDRVIRRRKENYSRLETASQSFRSASKFLRRLEDGRTPYVFPILLDKPNDLHSQLKEQGVPMWRWDDLRPSDCKVSQKYRDTLVQLPCHQELSKLQMDAMIECLLGVLG